MADHEEEPKNTDAPTDVDPITTDPDEVFARARRAGGATVSLQELLSPTATDYLLEVNNSVDDGEYNLQSMIVSAASLLAIYELIKPRVDRLEEQASAQAKREREFPVAVLLPATLTPKGYAAVIEDLRETGNLPGTQGDPEGVP